MPRLFLSALVAAVAFLTVSAGAQEPAAPTPAAAATPAPLMSDVEKQVRDVFQRQMDAYNAGSTEQVMATVHPESPVYASTEALLNKVTTTYKLNYKVSDLTFMLRDANEASLSFTQLTEKVEGPQFRNNLLKGVHIFRKHEGQWKLFETKLVSVEYKDK